MARGLRALPPRANLKEVLMDGEAIAAFGSCGMFREVGFDIASGRWAADRQEIQHEFRDGVGGRRIGGLDMGRIQRGDDLVPVALSGTKIVDEALEIEPVAEEMFQHGHAGRAAILNDDDRHAGRRHPGYEPLEMGKPFVRGNVVEGM